ncbi:hypothetical protein ACHAW5_002933 [Stephanodiscus triporus]|uniref:Uncharacterized protein n=1 Tax=Stephanodiscus triporus TaxID=2934178 RepID=A0ABD3NKT8_9STRA
MICAHGAASLPLPSLYLFRKILRRRLPPPLLLPPPPLTRPHTCREWLYEGLKGAAVLRLLMASCWLAALHLILVILGTFILKRFLLSFTVGCCLGLTVVTSQQDLLLCAAFYHNNRGDPVYIVIFANLAFALFGVLMFFSLILGHFWNYVIVRL